MSPPGNLRLSSVLSELFPCGLGVNYSENTPTKKYLKGHSIAID